MLGDFLSCSKGVKDHFEVQEGRCDFPQGFPTRLSHVPPWCVWILGFNVEAVQGNQVPLEWTEISGGLLEWWHTLEFLSPFLLRALPLERPRER